MTLSACENLRPLSECRIVRRPLSECRRKNIDSIRVPALFLRICGHLIILGGSVVQNIPCRAQLAADTAEKTMGTPKVRTAYMTCFSAVRNWSPTLEDNYVDGKPWRVQSWMAVRGRKAAGTRRKPRSGMCPLPQIQGTPIPSIHRT